MRIILILIFCYWASIEGFSQDLISLKAGDYREVKLLDFIDRKFIIQSITDSSSRSKVPVEVVENFYTANNGLLSKIRASAPKEIGKLLGYETAQSHLGKIEANLSTGDRAGSNTVLPIKRAAKSAIVKNGLDSSIYGVLPLKGRDVYFSRVVSVPGATKADLFHRARLWVALIYRSAPNVIKYESKENGTLIVKGLIRVDYYGKGGAKEPAVESTLYIRCRDGKVKIEEDDFTTNLTGNIGSDASLYTWARVLQEPIEEGFYLRVASSIKIFLDSLENELNHDPNNW